MTDPAIIEAAKWALQDNPGTAFQTYQELAEIAVAAVTSIIRAQVLEEAAQVAKGYYLFRTEDTEDVYHVCEAIAARIRAIKEQL